MVGSGRKRRGAARASRHSKKYWRKGAETEDQADEIQPVQLGITGEIKTAKEDSKGVRVAIDVKPSLTNNQKASLDRILRRRNVQLPTFPDRKAPRKLLRPKKEVKLVERVVFKIVPAKEDIWGKEAEAKIEDDGVRHFLQQTRVTRVKVPATLNLKPSALPAVSLPPAGVSYNPALHDYAEYAAKLIEKEAKDAKKEDKFERESKLTAGLNYCTTRERREEEMEGLFDDTKEAVEVEEEEEAPQHSHMPESVSRKKTVERKTKKQRRKEKERKKKEDESLRIAKSKNNQNDIFKVKKIARELLADEKAKIERIAERKKKKIIRDATQRKRLGRGKMQPLQEEVLLPSELPGSLRQLPPVGCSATDRLQSMQKRNMVEIAGDRGKKLKKRLRMKMKLTRAQKEVTIGSRVI